MKTISLILIRGDNIPTITEGLPVSKLEESIEGPDGELMEYALFVGEAVIPVHAKVINSENSRACNVEVKIFEDDEIYLAPDNAMFVSEAAQKRIMILWSFEGYLFATFGPDAKTFLARHDLYVSTFREAKEPVAMQGLVVLDPGECVYLHKNESDFIKIQNVSGRPIITL